MRHPILLSTLALVSAMAADKGQIASVLLKSGETVEGPLAGKSIQFGGRAVAVKDVVSVHTGDPASQHEAERIKAALATVAGPHDQKGNNSKVRNPAVAELVDIGLPVLTPLLESYKDSTLGEPAPHYRLFSRIIPSTADQLDRTADLLRLANGQEQRGEFSGDLQVGGKSVAASDVRRLAIRRAAVDRAVEVHSLRNCIHIEWLDTGVGVTADSALSSSARGFIRMSWKDDSWTSDADGLKKPGGNYKTNLFEGHPFGALMGRVGVTGDLWVAGVKASKSGLGSGRLYLGVNDNRHWENNLGSFKTTVRVTNAYDLGDPR